MSKKVIISAIVLLAVVTVGAALFMNDYLFKKANKEFVADYKTALQQHDAGNLDESISDFNELIKKAPTVSKATQSKLKLAFDMFSRNQGDDRENAIAIYKEIILDTSVSPFQRALTINDLLDLYQGTQDQKFAREVIFKGEPFGSFYQNGNLELAVRKAYEMADGFYPLSLTHFRIADIYASSLGNKKVSEESKDRYLTELRKWTEKGDTYLPQSLLLSYEKSKLAYIYQLQGMNREAIAIYTDKNYSKAESAFKNGLEVIAPEDELHSYGIGLFLRFHYAAMLARMDKETRKEDIKNLILPIINRPNKFQDKYFFFDDFLKNETAASHDSHGHKQDLIELTIIVPELKNFLASRGIKY